METRGYVLSVHALSGVLLTLAFLQLTCWKSYEDVVDTRRCLRMSLFSAIMLVGDFNAKFYAYSQMIRGGGDGCSGGGDGGGGNSGGGSCGGSEVVVVVVVLL